MTDPEFFVLCARKGALKLEIAGMKRRGRTAYSIVKEAYGLKGSRQSVLDQLRTMITDEQMARLANEDANGRDE